MNNENGLVKGTHSHSAACPSLLFISTSPRAPSVTYDRQSSHSEYSTIARKLNIITAAYETNTSQTVTRHEQIVRAHASLAYCCHVTSSSSYTEYSQHCMFLQTLRECSNLRKECGPWLLYRVPANSHRDVMSSPSVSSKGLALFLIWSFPFFARWSGASGASWCVVPMAPVLWSVRDGANPFGSSRVGALTTCARLGGGGCKAALSEATHGLYFMQVHQL